MFDSVIVITCDKRNFRWKGTRVVRYFDRWSSDNGIFLTNQLNFLLFEKFSLRSYFSLDRLEISLPKKETWSLNRSNSLLLQYFRFFDSKIRMKLFTPFLIFFLSFSSRSIGRFSNRSGLASIHYLRNSTWSTLSTLIRDCTITREQLKPCRAVNGGSEWAKGVTSWPSGSHELPFYLFFPIACVAIQA